LQVNQPQVQVSIGGAAIPGAVSVEIEQVAYFAADRFAVVFAMGAAETGAAYFAALGAQTVVIEAALAPGGFVSLLTGQVDNIRLDMPRNIAILTGRDLSAGLIDTEIAETFANQTASQIAQAIAARHSLTPNVSATSTPVGQYYDLDHARSALGLNSRAGTEWNLLSWLALIEGFVLSVTGTTLNFGPVPPGTPLFLTPLDCMELILDSATAIPATATVKSWNTRSKTIVTQTAGTGQGLSTTLIRPNLTSQQAMNLADNHLAGLAQHGTIMVATMPGELTLVPGATINLSETNSAFDQTYMVDTIRRSIDSARGFTQIVRAHAVS
jgi:phage protein D